MKKMLIAFAGLVFTSLTPVQANENAFQEMASIQTTFQVRPNARGLTVEEAAAGRTIVFRPEGSESSVLTYGPTKETQLVPIDQASIEFLVTGRGSVGLFLRGKPDLDTKGAYLALLNIGSNRTAMLRLFKHTIWPQSHPDDDLISMQELRSFATETWYRLEFRVTDETDGAATLKAVLTEVDSGSQVAEMEMQDLEGVLASEGLVALRMFSEKRTNGEIHVRNFLLKKP